MNKVETAIVKYVCPICGNVVEENIVINKRFTIKDAEQVKNLNGKVVGFSENACENCAKYKDKCTFLIEVDDSKSESGNPYRTGRYFGIRKDFKLFADFPQYVLHTKNGVDFCYADKEVVKKLGIVDYENN